MKDPGILEISLLAEHVASAFLEKEGPRLVSLDERVLMKASSLIHSRVKTQERSDRGRVVRNIFD